MDKNIKSILKTFESIGNSNKLFESPEFSADLLGGKNVKIPKDGAHAGQSGWPSRDAWDIPTPIGTPVYSITSGKVKTFSDYGPKVIKKNGKKLFGIGFTVESEDGAPDIYYTHLKDTKVKRGDSVKCGQLLGYVMDFPDSSYDHVHIGVDDKKNIRELIGNNGKIKCRKPGPMKNVEVGNDILDLIFGKSSDDNLLSKIGSTLTSMLNIKEQITDLKIQAKTYNWSGFDSLVDEVPKDLVKNFKNYMGQVEIKDTGKKCDGKITLTSSKNNTINFQVDHTTGCEAGFFPKTFKGLSIRNNGNDFSVSLPTSLPTPQAVDFDPDKGNVEISKDISNFVDREFSGYTTVKEEKVFGSFGKKTKTSGMSELIPKESNERILSSVKGFVNNTRAAHGCKNSITIETKIDDEPHFLQYCNISNPKVRDGQSVSIGTLLGTTKDDVEVTLYNRFFEKQRLNTYKKKEISTQKETPRMAPTPVFGKKKGQKPIEVKSKKVKQDYDYDVKDKEKKPFEYHNPLVGAAVDLALAPFTSKMTWPTEKKQPKPGSLLKSKKLKEETEKIKKLLK